eukprot:m.219309 g.219309  ORF g.219309 m.219309 type:complete len:138 (-) comp30422_c0_seq1:180-593(-)
MSQLWEVEGYSSESDRLNHILAESNRRWAEDQAREQRSREAHEAYINSEAYRQHQEWYNSLTCPQKCMYLLLNGACIVIIFGTVYYMIVDPAVTNVVLSLVALAFYAWVVWMCCTCCRNKSEDDEDADDDDRLLDDV